ncbi:hypothetical protein ACFQE1_02460 [Halobium palmae]|uniref:Uncharacterized protein n=1 Tax=Halobium palmae TaxID=1776492 RepID=A0ABD5RWC4_9EURY
MVSRENRVIAVCIVLAFFVGAGAYQIESWPEWAGFAAFVFTGVVLPTSINEYADRKRTTA